MTEKHVHHFLAYESHEFDIFLLMFDSAKWQGKLTPLF